VSERDDAKRPWTRSPERDDPLAAGRRAAKLLLLGGGAGLLAGGVQLGTIGAPRVMRPPGVRVTQVAGGMPAPPPPPWVAGALSQLRVDGAHAIAPGEQYQLRVVGYGQNYCVSDVTADASYQSLDPDVAQVSSEGLLTANAAGSATIVVSYPDAVGGVVHSASHVVNVTPRQTSGAPRGLYLNPGGHEQVPVGALQVVVTSYDGSGGMIDLTRAVTWRVSPPDAATIDAAGRLRLLRPGRVTVTATLDGLTGSAAYTVVAADAAPIDGPGNVCGEPVGE
jgi:hypothetical protein